MKLRFSAHVDVGFYRGEKSELRLCVGTGLQARYPGFLLPEKGHLARATITFSDARLGATGGLFSTKSRRGVWLLFGEIKKNTRGGGLLNVSFGVRARARALTVYGAEDD